MLEILRRVPARGVVHGLDLSRPRLNWLPAAKNLMCAIAFEAADMADD
jgi:hypothetical protein